MYFWVGGVPNFQKDGGGGGGAGEGPIFWGGDDSMNESDAKLTSMDISSFHCSSL